MTRIPKRKNLSLLIGIIIVAPLALGTIYLHDNPSDITSLASINSGKTPNGTNVTVKATITEITFLLMGTNDQVVHLSSPDGNLMFYWNEYRLEVGWTIIVCGTASQWNELHPVFSVDRVILFV